MSQVNELNQAIKDQIREEAYQYSSHDELASAYRTGALRWAIWKQKAEAAIAAFESAQLVIQVMNNPKNRSDLPDNTQFELFRERYGKYQEATKAIESFNEK